MTITNITERKNRRETYGHDERAINKHSVRVYQIFRVRGLKKMEFTLNRTLDGCPPFYSIYCFKPDSILPTYLNVKGVQYWGGGLSWPKAEQQAFKAITAFMEKSQ
jgi:hypothetical protein